MADNPIRKDIIQMGAFKVSGIKAKYKLDQNESPFRLPVSLRRKIAAPLFNGSNENRYPQPVDYLRLKTSAASFLNISPSNLVFTAGADQAILGSMMIAGDDVLLLSPTYPIYQNDAIILRKNIKTFSLEIGSGFSFEGLEREHDHDLVCLVSPNPPAGNLIPREIICDVCENNGIVILDEAYFEISGDEHIDLLERYENLIIIRTFSKACSLSGMRLGYMLTGHSDYANAVEKALFAPYNLSLMHYSLMNHFGEISLWGKEYGLRLRRTSQNFQKALSELGIRYFSSSANFVLTMLDNRVYSGLLEQGIKTRLMKINGEEMVRFSIGSAGEMSAVVTGLKSIL